MYTIFIYLSQSTFILTFSSGARIQFAFATVIKTNRSSSEDIDTYIIQTARTSTHTLAHIKQIYGKKVVEQTAVYI